MSQSMASRSYYSDQHCYGEPKRTTPGALGSAFCLVGCLATTAVALVSLRASISNSQLHILSHISNTRAIHSVPSTASTAKATHSATAARQFAATPISQSRITNLPQTWSVHQSVSSRVARLLIPMASAAVACISAAAVWRQYTARVPHMHISSMSGIAPLTLAAHEQVRMAATSGQTLTALCPVADGTEDIEFTTVTDILVRAGVKVVIASVMPSKTVTLARGLTLTAQVSIDDVSASDFDLVVCAGGMPGAEHFRDSKALNDIVVQMKKDGKLYAAICATPCVMFGHNPDIMQGLNRMTSFPAFHSKLRDLHPALKVSEDAVVVDGNCVTSQGPGTSMAFALQLVEMTVGAETAATVAKGLLYKM